MCVLMDACMNACMNACMQHVMYVKLCLYVFEAMSVSLSRCVHMYICMYVACIRMDSCMYVPMHINVYMYIDRCLYHYNIYIYIYIIVYMQTYLCIYVCVCALNLCTKHKHILFGARLPLHPIAAMHIASMCKMVGKHTTAETWGINSALALAEKNTLNDSPPWPTIVVQTTVITSVAVMRNTHVHYTCMAVENGSRAALRLGSRPKNISA